MRLISLITMPIKPANSLIGPSWALLAAIVLLVPKASLAATIIEGQYNGGARSGPLNPQDIWIGLGVAKAYKLQFIANASEKFFDISFTSVYGLDETMSADEWDLKVFAVDAASRTDLWSIEFKAIAEVFANDKVSLEDIKITHIIAPHLGEPPSNAVTVRDLEIMANKPLPFGAIFQIDDIGMPVSALHGEHEDIVNRARLVGNMAPPDPFVVFRDFKEWHVEFEAVHVPEPSTYAMALAGLACGGYSMWRRLKRA